MHQFNIHIPTLVQIMAVACCLLDIKPLFKPMLPYCWLDPNISVKPYLKFKSFSSRKCTWKCRLQNGSHFISALMCDIYDINPICDTILWHFRKPQLCMLDVMKMWTWFPWFLRYLHNDVPTWRPRRRFHRGKSEQQMDERQRRMDMEVWVRNLPR